VGSSASWTMEPYYDPTKGPSSPIIPDAGVLVKISHGDICESLAVERNAHLWLKCDATKTGPIESFEVTEADPSNPTIATPCSYFAVISHASFCPTSGPNPPLKGPMPLHEAALSFLVPVDQVTVVGSPAEAFLGLGLTCKSVCPSNGTIVSCTGSVQQPAKVLANVSYIQGSGGQDTFTLSTVGPPQAECPAQETYFVSSNGGLWAQGPDGLTAYDATAPVFSISLPTASHCVTCGSH